MTPAFRHMGGKARLRKWLVSHFPDGDSGLYLEPFAGKGNVYYEARRRLRYDRWALSDINAEFLFSVLRADLDSLPEAVDRSDFETWKNNKRLIATLIEPRITFAGKGYGHGFSGSSGTHVGYSGPQYRRVCEAARVLLQDVDIQQLSWEQALDVFRPSFVYLDPPYYGTNASYKNIDHGALIQRLNGATFDWALSGYRNSLYDTKLDFRCRFEYERNSEIKSSNSGKREAVIETLWTNYDL